MKMLRSLKSKILVEGEDGRIDEQDLALVRSNLPADGSILEEDMRVLIELRSEARSVCPEFDAWFFPVFKAWLLADGKISLSEQFQLLRMLYGGGGIDPAEKAFLQELRKELGKLSAVTPEFEALYQQAMRDAGQRGT
jgi:hypothetical protein